MATIIDQDAKSNGRHALGHRCLVLVKDPTSASDDLLCGLAKRGSRLQVVHEPTTLLVEMAKEAARVVILNEPEKIQGLRDLLAVLKQYYPNTACWRCEMVNGQTRLLRVHQAAAVRSIGAEPPNGVSELNAIEGTADSELGVPDGRDDDHDDPRQDQDGAGLGSGVRGNGFHSRPDTQTRLTNPLITQEEMSMLIGPGFGRGGAGKLDHSGVLGSDL